jgi:hypothetical protein
MNKREFFTQVYLSLVPQMFDEMKEIRGESDDLDGCIDIAGVYADLAKSHDF